MTPAMLILGWERFTMLRFTEGEAAHRLLSLSPHLITPDRMRFAPVRLLRELGLGKPLAQAEKDSAEFAGLRSKLEGNGWRVLRHGDDGWDALSDRLGADCATVGPGTPPDPVIARDRVFIVPA